MPLTPVVKLGGSVITRKQGPARLRPKVLARLAREISSYGSPAVILHGAGSFGHPEAARWQLASPPSDRARERSRGASLVSQKVRTLNRAVVGALLESGMEAASLPPLALARNRSGSLAAFGVAPIQQLISQHVTPVLFGDVVLDDEWGFSILSADTIALELVRQKIAGRAIFVSDVAGILREGSGRPKIYEAVSTETLDSLRPPSGAPDVTGGIRAKAKTMLSIAQLGADAVLISGLSDGALARALRGESVYGSWARASRG